MSRRTVEISEIMHGVTVDLEDTEVVTTAICIALVMPMEGDDHRPSLVIAHTPGTTWITQRGMLHAALDIERGVGHFIDKGNDHDC